MDGDSNNTTASLSELLRAHESGKLRVPPDLAAYVLLCLAEQLRDDQHFVGAILSVEGTVALVNGSRSKDSPSATAALALQLREFLAFAGTPSLSLQTLALAPATTPVMAWAESLAKSLMPLNREASKRALGRCIRELKRAESTLGLRAISLGDGSVPDRLSLTPPPPAVSPVLSLPLAIPISADRMHTARAEDAPEPVSARLRVLLGEYDAAQSQELDGHLRAMAGLDAEAPVSRAPPSKAVVLERVATSEPHTAAKFAAGTLVLALGLAWALWPKVN